MPSLDGEYRRHPRPEYRLHYSGDVGRLLVGYDKVCRFVNVRTIEEALAARLKDHQSPADGKQDEPTLSRLDLSGVVAKGTFQVELPFERLLCLDVLHRLVGERAVLALERAQRRAQLVGGRAGGAGRARRAGGKADGAGAGGGRGRAQLLAQLIAAEVGEHTLGGVDLALQSPQQEG